MGALVITHGGAGVPGRHSDGCVTAARAGLAALQQGGNALDAACAAVRVLEDDARYNAGLGATIRLDGVTVELDAGVADETHFGAVAAVRGLRHPVDLARAVLNSPHVMLVGEGAQALARRLGMAEQDLTTDHKRQAARVAWDQLQEDPRWAGRDVHALWNFELPPPSGAPAATRDTVGAVVRDAAGRLACAGSTGGTAQALRGRVGDTPIFGAGFYCSPAAAVVATGLGEQIWREMTCRTVHEYVVAGMAAQQAADEHCQTFPAAWDVGVVLVTPTGWGAATNRKMSWAAVDATGVLATGTP